MGSGSGTIVGGGTSREFVSPGFTSFSMWPMMQPSKTKRERERRRSRRKEKRKKEGVCVWGGGDRRMRFGAKMKTFTIKQISVEINCLFDVIIDARWELVSV